MGTGGDINHILILFPPRPYPSWARAVEGFRDGAVNGSDLGHPIAECSQADDARVDSASEGGAESEYIGVRFARSNTGPSAQHVDGGGSEGR